MFRVAGGDTYSAIALKTKLCATSIALLRQYCKIVSCLFITRPGSVGSQGL